MHKKTQKASVFKACFKIFSLFILLTIFNSAKCQSVDISNFGNGILISSSAGKVLIDGTIFTCPEIADKLVNTQAPFDSMNLILTTHNHSDHFLQQYINEILKSDTSCRSISITDVNNELKNDPSYTAELADRIVDISPSKYTGKDTTINNIEFRVIHIPHFPGFGEIPNNAYLLHINGFKILHMGDAWGTGLNDFKNSWTENDSIDIALINNEFFTSEGLSIVKTIIKPKYLFITHLGQPGVSLIQQIKDSLPFVKVAARGRYDMEITHFSKTDSTLTDSVINYRPQFEKYTVTDTAHVGEYYEFTYNKNWIINTDSLDTLKISSIQSTGEFLPEWLSFDTASLKFHGIPPEAKKISLKLTATDNYFASNYGNIKIIVADSTTNLETVYSNESVVTYPNPFGAEINIVINAKNKSRISIYTTDGKLIYKEQLNSASEMETVKWDGCDIAGNKVKIGTYIYAIKAGEEVISGEIIKY